MSCPECEELKKRVANLEKALEEAYKAECRLLEIEDKYQRHIENANSIIMRIDREGKILFINRYATELFGFANQDLVGKNLVGTIVPEVETTGRDLRDMVRDIGIHPERYLNNINQNVCQDGRIVWVNWTNKPVYNEQGEVEEIFCVGNDFTDFKNAEEKLAYIAFHDPLTGLYNRKMFMQQLDEALRQGYRYSGKLAVLFVDLDNFKKVNDTRGHECGDVLLSLVAERIRELVRDSDIVGRFGGDEFVILLVNPGEVFPGKVAGRLQQALATPKDLPSGPVDYISSSIGISFYPEDATEAHDLLRRADEAMYKAKNAGKNRFCFFSAERVASEE
jgi:diguanylate cyclase (GGDEF)-like protein/PAS domain S-box-containing protein